MLWQNPAAGAGLTGTKMARRMGDVDEFMFKAIGENHNQGVSPLGSFGNCCMFSSHYIFYSHSTERYASSVRNLLVSPDNSYLMFFSSWCDFDLL